jgi:hypothetical protein
MKITIKYVSAAIIIVVSMLLTSCMQEVVGPVGKTSTKMQINLSNLQTGNHTPLADAMLKIKNSSNKTVKVTNANGDTLTIDEVKLVLLDMTKYTNWSDFLSKWQTTGQYGLMDTAIFYKMEREGKDAFEIYNTMFKSYTGTEYSYIGDYGFSLSGGTASATINLNPGLNYYYYAFRNSGKDTSLYTGDGNLDVIENVDNTIQIGKLDVSGSYSGTWGNTTGDTSGSMTLDIYQSANDSVKGVIVMRGFSCFDSLDVSGKIYSGSDYVSLYIARQGYSGSLSITPSGAVATGSWYIYPSCRSFYYGNVTLRRNSTTPNLGKAK